MTFVRENLLLVIFLGSAAVLDLNPAHGFVFVRHEEQHSVFAGPSSIESSSTSERRRLATALQSSASHTRTIDSNCEEEEESAATLRSLIFCNIQKDKEPELLCDFLMEIGACSASMTDADRGTDLEDPIFSEPTNFNTNDDPWNDSLRWAAPIWNRCNVTAHFPSSIDLNGVVNFIADVFPEQFPLDGYSVERVPNKDWVVHVQSQWSPIVIPNTPFVLRFPWHTKEDIQKVVDQNGEHITIDSVDDRVELKLQGGIAFGTGEHPTTQLCLEWIHHHVSEMVATKFTNRDDDNEPQDEVITVMDYGSGSGVLGLAACALAPGKVKSIGTDIDVDAIRIADANAKENDLDMKNYLPPLVDSADAESKSLLLKAHAHAKKQFEEHGEGHPPFDVVLSDNLAKPTYDIAVANILAGPLVALASTIASLVRPGGRLAMSGILPHQGDVVVDAYSEYFDNCQVEKELGGWILVTGTRKAS